MNNKLLRALLADASAWEFVSFEDLAKAPAAVISLYPAVAAFS